MKWTKKLSVVASVLVVLGAGLSIYRLITGTSLVQPKGARHLSVGQRYS